MERKPDKEAFLEEANEALLEEDWAYQYLLELASSRFIWVRVMVAEALANCVSSRGKRVLLPLLQDRHPLVRAEALDSSRYFSGEDLRNTLQESMMKDSHYS